MAELNALRDTIAKEKLPLAQELTSLEEKLTRLRRDHEAANRRVDEAALAATRVKGGIKAQQDELAYVGNLLDEYAKTFESKVNVSELQYCGEALTAAKQAVENTTLTASERFARQTAFVDLSLKRLTDVIGGMRFAGVGVDLQGMVANGQFAIIGPIALFRADNGSTAGLVLSVIGNST